MGSEIVHARDEQRGPEGPDPAVLRIVLFVIADALHEEVDSNLFAVRDLVDLCYQARIVHEDPGIRDESRGRRPDVVVDLEDLLDRSGFHQSGAELLVGHQDDSVLELQADRGVPTGHGDACVLDLEQAAVGAEDRNRAVVCHLARLHLITLGPLIKRSIIRVLCQSRRARARGLRYFRVAARIVPEVPTVVTWTSSPAITSIPFRAAIAASFSRFVVRMRPDVPSQSTGQSRGVNERNTWRTASRRNTRGLSSRDPTHLSRGRPVLTPRRCGSNGEGVA